MRLYVALTTKLVMTYYLNVALLSNMGRLPGFDGKAKMSKSLGNTTC